MAAFLPCCGRAELPPAAARPAQELPFGRSSGDPPSQHRGGAPNSCERARGQAPLSGASKTSKVSYCAGRGGTGPSPALEAAHTYPTGAAPLARGYGPAHEPPSRPPGYRLESAAEARQAGGRPAGTGTAGRQGAVWAGWRSPRGP